MNATTLPVEVASAVSRRAPRTMSALERHGIDHLSPSSLNAWIASPAFWIMERLLGLKGPVGCAAHRGTAVEAGVSHGLFNPSVSATDCAVLALETYWTLAASSSDPKRDQEAACVSGMVAQALLALRPLGVPERPADSHQHRVEVRLDGVPVPVIGYLDWWFPDRGLVVDLKTTMRVPSNMSDSHIRQGSLYQHASANAEVQFVYCSDKRSAPLTLDRVAYGVGIVELTHSARRLETFLSLSDDPYELAQLVTPDFGSFYWSAPETRALGRKAFGF